MRRRGCDIEPSKPVMERRVLEGGRHCSALWRSVCRVWEGLGEGVGRWFDDNIRQVVGDGRNTLVWHDNWVGDIPLRCRFPCLFDLAVKKECSMEEMSRVGWEVGGRSGSGVVGYWIGRRIA